MNDAMLKYLAVQSPEGILSQADFTLRAENFMAQDNRLLKEDVDEFKEDLDDPSPVLPYQQLAINWAISRRHGIFYHYPGTGKTHIIAGIISHFFLLRYYPAIKKFQEWVVTPDVRKVVYMSKNQQLLASNKLRVDLQVTLAAIMFEHRTGFKQSRITLREHLANFVEYISYDSLQRKVKQSRKKDEIIAATGESAEKVANLDEIIAATGESAEKVANLRSEFTKLFGRSVVPFDENFVQTPTFAELLQRFSNTVFIFDEIHYMNIEPSDEDEDDTATKDTFTGKPSKVLVNFVNQIKNTRRFVFSGTLLRKNVSELNTIIQLTCNKEFKPTDTSVQTYKDQLYGNISYVGEIVTPPRIRYVGNYYTSVAAIDETVILPGYTSVAAIDETVILPGYQDASHLESIIAQNKHPQDGEQFAVYNEASQHLNHESLIPPKDLRNKYNFGPFPDNFQDGLDAAERKLNANVTRTSTRKKKEADTSVPTRVRSSPSYRFAFNVNLVRVPMSVYNHLNSLVPDVKVPDVKVDDSNRRFYQQSRTMSNIMALQKELTTVEKKSPSVDKKTRQRQTEQRKREQPLNISNSFNIFGLLKKVVNETESTDFMCIFQRRADEPRNTVGYFYDKGFPKNDAQKKSELHDRELYSGLVQICPKLLKMAEDMLELRGKMIVHSTWTASGIYPAFHIFRELYYQKYGRFPKTIIPKAAVDDKDREKYHYDEESYIPFESLFEKKKHAELRKWQIKDSAHALECVFVRSSDLVVEPEPLDILLNNSDIARFLFVTSTFNTGYDTTNFSHMLFMNPEETYVNEHQMIMRLKRVQGHQSSRYTNLWNALRRLKNLDDVNIETIKTMMNEDVSTNKYVEIHNQNWLRWIKESKYGEPGVIEVRRYVTIPRDIVTIASNQMRRRELAPYERMMKEVAVDCFLNYSQNVQTDTCRPRNGLGDVFPAEVEDEFWYSQKPASCDFETCRMVCHTSSDLDVNGQEFTQKFTQAFPAHPVLKGVPADQHFNKLHDILNIHIFETNDEKRFFNINIGKKNIAYETYALMMGSRASKRIKKAVQQTVFEMLTTKTTDPSYLFSDLIDNVEHTLERPEFGNTFSVRGVKYPIIRSMVEVEVNRIIDSKEHLSVIVYDKMVEFVKKTDVEWVKDIYRIVFLVRINAYVLVVPVVDRAKTLVEKLDTQLSSLYTHRGQEGRQYASMVAPASIFDIVRALGQEVYYPRKIGVSTCHPSHSAENIGILEKVLEEAYNEMFDIEAAREYHGQLLPYLVYVFPVKIGDCPCFHVANILYTGELLSKLLVKPKEIIHTRILRKVNDKHRWDDCTPSETRQAMAIVQEHLNERFQQNNANGLFDMTRPEMPKIIYRTSKNTSDPPPKRRRVSKSDKTDASNEEENSIETYGSFTTANAKGDVKKFISEQHSINLKFVKDIFDLYKDENAVVWPYENLVETIEPQIVRTLLKHTTESDQRVWKAFLEEAQKSDRWKN